ncbi:hypothetical protein QBC41DRAFT_63871 [Cercophora samala]|uniref:Uncharacterized protein n=1 Tax=Cercophora samala TaxID=330535 RepID=A0AA39ZI39_9PEZI|nr:hypothetical protein QBC41DRAFT_63871 [Cercophora samala]
MIEAPPSFHVFRDLLACSNQDSLGSRSPINFHLSASDLHLTPDQKLQNPLFCPPPSLSIHQSFKSSSVNPLITLASVLCNAVVCQQQVETSDLRSDWLSTDFEHQPPKSLFFSRPPGIFQHSFTPSSVHREVLSSFTPDQTRHPRSHSSFGRAVKLVHKATLRHYNPSVSLAPLWSSVLNSSHTVETAAFDIPGFVWAL